ncbi:MAG TPA: nucleotide exchange factor GrpE [Pyrinomonadaceae bacterium]|nr:nucleotide exchange factor GrpE [Pyrinomonadaceae bacterium]
MTTGNKERPSGSIPIRFVDDEDQDMTEPSQGNVDFDLSEVEDESLPIVEIDSGEVRGDLPIGGPELAELIAARSELKRLQSELTESREAVARRQADFENYRKRIERERAETFNRVVADVARKLLPVVDNLARAVDAEQTVQSHESKEFKHFLHGIELINKQLCDVLESLGILPIAAVGERFDPHIHEAVATEPSDKFEPDMVTEEITRGYRIGERLLRPAMVKVAARTDEAA